MNRLAVFAFVLMWAGLMTLAVAAPPPPNGPSTGGQVDFGGFRNLSEEVQAYRANRLVSHAQFEAMARQPGTIILDARSASAYRMGHIAGAINLSLTDFTAQSLAATIPNPNTRILIYCNNNFSGAPGPFPTKLPSASLNLSTFAALYDYGYRNVYELRPLLDARTTRIAFAGSLAAAVRVR